MHPTHVPCTVLHCPPSHARTQATRHDHVVVNGHPPAMKYRGYLQPADVVSPGSGSRHQFMSRIARSLGPDILDEAKRALVV